jgi:hypothetical protein
MTRRVYAIVPKPEGDTYRALLAVVSTFAVHLGFIVRSTQVQLAQAATDVLRDLEPDLLTIDEVAAWPGTELKGGRRSRRFLYVLNAHSLGTVLDATDDLYKWVNPGLPEDLHFLRLDGSPVLGSVAQDLDAWVERNDTELMMWRAAGGPELRVEAAK